MAITEKELDERVALVRRSIRSVRRYYGLSAQRVAELFGEGSGQWVYERENGRTRLTARDLAAFAELFGIPAGLFYEGGDACIQHLIDNGPSDHLRGERPSRYIDPFPGHALNSAPLQAA